jgi:hypothetical protein
MLLIMAGICVSTGLPAQPPAFSAALVPSKPVCRPRNIGGGDAVTIFQRIEATHEPVIRAIAFGHNRTMKVTYDVTNQGNGTLQIANLLLRPYSESDAVRRYQGHALDVLLFPDSATGYCSIAVSGIIETTGEKDDGIAARRPALAIYRLAKSGRFVREVAEQADLFDLTR